ncbi:MAG: DUF1565 domain-containing protein [candidate division Zixibacteria bacterium]|nr:DUF1565 domain-containing protein [candidate division Zixibacteria bacterium]
MFLFSKLRQVLRCFVILIFPLLIVFTLNNVSLADYHYASHEGSSEYPYTSWETAADSIQKAIDAAEPGDTVYVGAGTYYENIDLKDTLAVIGMNWENAKIHSTGRIVDGGEGAIFNGFWIEGENNTEDKGIVLGALAGSRYMEVKDCKITNCWDGILGWAGGIFRNNIIMNNEYGMYILDYPATPLIEYNTIIDNEFIGIAGMYISLVIRNNFIARNRVGGIDYEHPYRVDMSNNVLFDNGIASSHSTQVNFGFFGERFIYNNYFGMSDIRVTGLVLDRGNAEDSVINNIFQHCKYGIYLYKSFGNIFYNDFFDNEENILLDNAEDSLWENIYVNPMVTSEEDGFYLQAFSPCIDSGDPEKLDIDNSRSDIGVYGGPFGESYDYQDLPPEPPESLWAEILEPDTILIQWSSATETDFNYYNLYRDTLSGFEPSINTLLFVATDSFYYDTDWENQQNYFYKITSVDNQDNESEPSQELEVVLTSVDDNPFDPLPKTYILNQNYPNPFNPETRIKYILPNVGAQPAQVELVIYNIMGEEVIKLVDKRQYPGDYVVAWDGKDAHGTEVSSGIYFYSLKIWGTALIPVRKMVRLK